MTSVAMLYLLSFSIKSTFKMIKSDLTQNLPLMDITYHSYEINMQLTKASFINIHYYEMTTCVRPYLY